MTDQVLVYGKYRHLYSDKNGEYVKYNGKKLYLHTYINNLAK